MGFKQNSHLLAIIASSVIWGFFAISLKQLSLYSSEVILNWRIIISFMILWIIIILSRKELLIKEWNSFSANPLKIKIKIISLISISGIFLTLNWLYFIYVTNQVSLKSAAFAYITCPLITALAGLFILKEKLTNLKLLALFLATISIIGLARGSLIEILWSLLIATLYAFFLIIQRILKNFDKLIMLGLQLLISLVLIIPKLINQHNAFPSDKNFWLQILIISIIFTIVPLLLSLYALKKLPSSTVGITIYINPIISYSVAYYFFNEYIKKEEIVYYIILFVAVIVFNGDVIFKSILNLSKKQSF